MARMSIDDVRLLIRANFRKPMRVPAFVLRDLLRVARQDALSREELLRRLVYGEGIWSAPPTPAATAPLAGRDDEYVELGALVGLAERHGFAMVSAHEATLDEWDRFESGFTARHARWLAEQGADHPDADEVRERAERQHTAYFQGYRGILGLAYLQLVAM